MHIPSLANLPLSTLVVITSGCDWYDASFEHILLNDGVDLKHAHEQWREWYSNEYVPALHAGKRPAYSDFTSWLIVQGLAIKANIDIFHDD